MKAVSIMQRMVYTFHGVVFNRFMYWQPVQVYDVAKFGVSTDAHSQLHYFVNVVNSFEGILVTVQKLHYCSLVLIAPMTLPRIYVP